MVSRLYRLCRGDPRKKTHSSYGYLASSRSNLPQENHSKIPLSVPRSCGWADWTWDKSFLTSDFHIRGGGGRIQVWVGKNPWKAGGRLVSLDGLLGFLLCVGLMLRDFSCRAASQSTGAGTEDIPTHVLNSIVDAEGVVSASRKSCEDLQEALISVLEEIDRPGKRYAEYVYATNICDSLYLASMTRRWYAHPSKRPGREPRRRQTSTRPTGT